MVWSDSLKQLKMAIALESEAGTAETTPEEYCLVDAGAMDDKRGQDEFRALGERTTMFSIPTPYYVEASMGSWVFPELNGSGHLLTGAIGSDAVTRVATASASYAHVITEEDTLATFTLWDKNRVLEQKANGCVINKYSLQQAARTKLYQRADIIGMSLGSTADYGTEAYVTGGNKAFRSGVGKVLFADVLDATILDFNINIDNSVDPNESIPIGYDSPNHLVPDARKIAGDFTFFIEDTTKLEAYWGASTGPSLTPTESWLQFIWESATIETLNTPTTAIKEGGAGTATLTPSGTYTGTGRAFFEIKCASAGKIQHRLNWGTWSDEETAGETATLISDGISYAVSEADNLAVGDRWSFVVGTIPYRLDIELPSARLTGMPRDYSGTRLKAKATFTGTMAQQRYGTTAAFGIRAKLYNTKSASYRAAPA